VKKTDIKQVHLKRAQQLLLLIYLLIYQRVDILQSCSSLKSLQSSWRLQTNCSCIHVRLSAQRNSSASQP